MDIKKVTNDWTNADQFLDEKYTRSKQYVDNMLDPTFIVENNTVATKAVPDKASMAMIAKICGKTVKDGTTLKSAAVESVVSQGVNRVIKEEIKNGYYAGTEYNSSASFRTTEFIRVDSGATYAAGIYNSNEDFVANLVWCTYDASGAAVRTNVQARTLTVASNEKYVRVRTASAQTDLVTSGKFTFVVIKSDTIHFYPYNKTTVLVPSSVKNLPDYGCSAGNIANEIDFENGVYYHRVGSVDMGTLPWGYNNDASHETMRARVTGIKKQVGGNAANIITGKFETRQIADPWNHSVNNSIGVLDTDEVIVIYSSTMGTDATAFKNSLVGQKLNYELASVETIPLSDYLRPLPVEVGGTITLVNPYNLDMNSTIKYKKEV